MRYTKDKIKKLVEQNRFFCIVKNYKFEEYKLLTFNFSKYTNKKPNIKEDKNTILVWNMKLNKYELIDVNNIEKIEKKLD